RRQRVKDRHGPAASFISGQFPRMEVCQSARATAWPGLWAHGLLRVSYRPKVVTFMAAGGLPLVVAGAALAVPGMVRHHGAAAWPYILRGAFSVSALTSAAMAGCRRSLARQRPRLGPMLPTGMPSLALIWAYGTGGSS